MSRYAFRIALNINSLENLAKQLQAEKDVILSVFGGVQNGYRKKIIPKKDSSPRNLWVPNDFLKNIQNRIYLQLLQKIPLPSCVHGGVRGRSIITNARCHIGKEWVANIDIKDFFNSVHYSRILKLFRALGCNEKISEILTGLVTYKHCLPQGAPTSPCLSNLILFNLDKRFILLCKNNGIMYTRYFDDITLSGDKRVNHETMKKQYRDIIETEGYQINHKKVEFYHKTEKQKVNGIVVNTKLEADDEFIDDLEKCIDGLYKFGLRILKGDCFFKERKSISGKIEFLRSINKIKAEELNKKLSLVNWEF